MTAVLALLALLASAAVQQPPADPTTGASRFALASVLDPRNRPVVDVGADDFVIQEAGVAREVLSVRPADYPVVVMIDTGIDARVDFGMMKRAAEHFIERIGPRPLAIGTFGGAPKMIVGFDDDPITLGGVKEGTVAATVVQQPFEWAYQGMKLMASYLKGDKSGLPANNLIIIPTKIIGKDDVDAYAASLKAMSGK